MEDISISESDISKEKTSVHGRYQYREDISIHGALQGSRQGLFPRRRFLLLNQQLGNDLT